MEAKDAPGSIRLRTPPHGSVRVRSTGQCQFSNFRFMNAFYTLKHPHICILSAS